MLARFAQVTFPVPVVLLQKGFAVSWLGPDGPRIAFRFHGASGFEPIHVHPAEREPADDAYDSPTSARKHLGRSDLVDIQISQKT